MTDLIRIERGAEVDGPERTDGRPHGHRHGVWEYHAPRYPLVCGYSRQPLLDACRQLKSMYGLTAELVGVFREGRSEPDITCPVEKGALVTVSEPSKGSIRFEKYRAFDFTALRQTDEV